MILRLQTEHTKLGVTSRLTLHKPEASLSTAILRICLHENLVKYLVNLDILLIVCLHTFNEIHATNFEI